LGKESALPKTILYSLNPNDNTIFASIIGCFQGVGMLTDSRNFLCYPRHEYFRRILCNMLGEWIENGEIPDDFEHIGRLVQDICYNNAKIYFGM
jgi:glucuronate isomerase